MIHWFKRIFVRPRTLLSSQSQDALIHEIAERSAADTRQRLGADLATMTAAELRGYVKARAYREVRRHTMRKLTKLGAEPVQAEEWFLRALERTTQLVVKQPRLRTSTGPSRQVPLRIAG